MSCSEVKSNGKQGKQPDARRNLYVLGLPFELTKYVSLLLVLALERSVTVCCKIRVRRVIFSIWNGSPRSHSRHR